MPTKTLIVSPAWIGDMLMSQPLSQLLKQLGHEIDVLAPQSTLPIAERMPEINQCIESPFKHGELNLLKRHHIAKSLRKHQYDQAIVLPNSFKSALIPWWAHIPKRTGWLGEKRYILLNDFRQLVKSDYPSLIKRYAALGLPDKDGMPSLANPKLETDPQNLKQCLQALNLEKDRPIIALCPGAEYGPTKRWPAENFGHVASHFILKKWQVWIFGTEKEKQAANKIQEMTKNACTDLTGKTSLHDAIDLLSIANIALSNDSGLMHIAAAVNTPLVALYGSTSPIYTPPASKNATILQLDYDCIPCFKRECPLQGEEHLRCLKHLYPATVVRALEEHIR